MTVFKQVSQSAIGWANRLYLYLTDIMGCASLADSQTSIFCFFGEINSTYKLLVVSICDPGAQKQS